MSKPRTSPEARAIWFDEAEKLKISCDNEIELFDADSSPKEELQTIYFFRTLGLRVQQLIKDIDILESEFGGKDETKWHQGQ